MTGKAGVTVLTASIRRALSLASSKRWFGLALGLLLYGTVIAIPEAWAREVFDSGGGYSLEVDAQDERVTLRAVGAPWKPLLDELTERTGTRFHYASVPRDPATVSCIEMTATELLACLWGGALMARAAAMPAGSAAPVWPAEVWLMGLPGEFRPEEEPMMPRRSDSLPPAAPSETAGGHDRQRWVAMLEGTKSTDADVRLRALTTLAGSKVLDPAARAAFRAALLDDVAEVRAQAVWALSKAGGPEAFEVLRDALRDRDATVRLMAVDSAKPDRQGGMLIREVLADSDETVRTAAAVKIRAIEHRRRK